MIYAHPDSHTPVSIVLAQSKGIRLIAEGNVNVSSLKNRGGKAFFNDEFNLRFSNLCGKFNILKITLDCNLPERYFKTHLDIVNLETGNSYEIVMDHVNKTAILDLPVAINNNSFLIQTKDKGLKLHVTDFSLEKETHSTGFRFAYVPLKVLKSKGVSLALGDGWYTIEGKKDNKGGRGVWTKKHSYLGVYVEKAGFYHMRFPFIKMARDYPNMKVLSNSKKIDASFRKDAHYIYLELQIHLEKETMIHFVLPGRIYSPFAMKGKNQDRRLLGYYFALDKISIEAVR